METIFWLVSHKIYVYMLNSIIVLYLWLCLLSSVIAGGDEFRQASGLSRSGIRKTEVSISPINVFLGYHKVELG